MKGTVLKIVIYIFPELLNVSSWSIVQIIQSHYNICFDAIQNGGKSEFSTLKQTSFVKFPIAENWKPCEIYRRMLNEGKEVFFSPKMFMIVIYIILPQHASVKKTVYEVEPHWLSAK